MKKIKETYETPAVEVVKIKSADIITVSLPDETVDD